MLPPDSAKDILPARGWHDKGRKALGINRRVQDKKVATSRGATDCLSIGGAGVQRTV